VQWYAIFVRTGEEENLQKLIQILLPDQRIETLVPKRKIMERRLGRTFEKEKKLFPGYVLMKTDMNMDVYYRLRNMPNILSILHDRNIREPVSIPEEEMSVILNLTRDGETIEFSTIYKEGDRIKVTAGPLKGMEGIIEKYDHRKKRVRVRLDFLGEKRKVDLGAYMVE